jgi:cell division protein ZapA
MIAEQPREPAGPAMSQVTVTINGRQFRMQCEAGQEAHLRRLASDLDQRMAKLRSEFGEIGDTRLTVMAALTLSDELAEMVDKVRQLEQELAALQDARLASSDHAKLTQAAVAAALEAAAERIEGIARRLNQPRSSGGAADQDAAE